MAGMGRVGIWSGLRSWDPGAVGAAAAAVESSGFGALWIPGGAGGDVLDRCRAALAATTDLVVAPGILNIWRHDAREVAAETAALRAASGDRFLLGLGVSHELLIGEEYVVPLAKMRSYLDELDAAGQSPDGARPRRPSRPDARPGERRGRPGPTPTSCRPSTPPSPAPRLAPGRCWHPSRPSCWSRTRSRGGRWPASSAPATCLCPTTRTTSALGYTDEDLAPPGSDRLVDAMVAWGSAADIAERVQAHLDAGADHVCLQVVRADDGPSEADIWQELAGVLPH